jgi:hypothetical protein
MARRDHANVDLLLSGQTYPGDEAGPEVNQGAIRARNVGIRIEEDSPRSCRTHRLPQKIMGNLPLKNLRRQVSALLTAHRALGDDPR